MLVLLLVIYVVAMILSAIFVWACVTISKLPCEECGKRPATEETWDKHDLCAVCYQRHFGKKK